MSREDDVASDTDTYHGPRRKTSSWVAIVFVLLLIGAFIYVIAADDPDSCFGSTEPRLHERTG